MVHTMEQTPQPAFLSSWLGSFGSFDDAHGWSVNLFVVISLAGIGALFLTGKKRLVLGGLVAFIVLSLADWVLVEDLGFLGGVGTDPNSMLPMALLFGAGYLAIARLPAEAPAPIPEVPIGEEIPQIPSGAWWGRATLSYLLRVTAAATALAVVVIGTAPMAMAAVNPTADPILSEAVDGTPNAIDMPAPPFALVDQHGHEVSLADLRTHVVALTFLDPVCTSDCPLIAQDFRQADNSSEHRTAAWTSSPSLRTRTTGPCPSRMSSTGRRISRTLSNWYYLTGSLPALEGVWNSYGEPVQTVPDGAMVAHGDLAFVIDGRGHERDALVDDPGPSQTTASSFSSLLVNQIDQILNS